MAWSPRARLIALALAALLVVGLAVFIAGGGRDDAQPPASQPGSPETTAAPTTRGVVARRWPLNKQQAQQVATRFAVPFSNHLPTTPNATRSWLDSLRPHADPAFVARLSERFEDYWWYLISGGLGAERARVASITVVWEKTDAAMFRVVVDRTVRSFLNEPVPSRPERVSWDITVTSPTAGEPRVSGCLRTQARPDSQLSDPYSPGEVDG